MSIGHNGEAARGFDSADFNVIWKARAICRRTNYALEKAGPQWTPFGQW